jgi:hypothetical protein
MNLIFGDNAVQVISNLKKSFTCFRLLVSCVMSLSILSHSSLIAADKYRIAVMDFNANNISPYAAKAVSEMIAT